MITAGATLTVWERAAPLSGLARATAMITGTGDGVCLDSSSATTGSGSPDQVSLGRRDAALLRLYRDIRGPVVEALATCPACEETLEVSLPVAHLLVGYAADRPDATADPVAEITVGSKALRVRCPTPADLDAIAGLPDQQTAAVALLQRCVERVGSPDPATSTVLDAAERQAVSAALESLDPLQDIRIDIACGQCGEGWSAFLDVPPLAWEQVNNRARRLLREVDALAARYGWSESAILALSESRRAAYLDLH